VARRHGLSKNTVHSWIQATRKTGSVVPLPRNEGQRIIEVENRLETLGQENDLLKRGLCYNSGHDDKIEA
jgi:transposase-like protein